MRSLFISGLLVGLLVLSGCGSSSSPTVTKSPTAGPTAATTAPAPSSGGALKLAADPSGALKFNTSSLEAKAGNVTIDFTNSSSLAHNVTIASANGVVGATPTFQGGSKSLTVSLKPGTYTFYCSVPGHRQAGMHGTLVVK